MSMLLHYHNYIMVFAISSCLSVLADRPDDLKRNPFEWTGKKINIPLTQEMEEKNKEKKTLNIPFLWKVIGISSGEYALLTANNANVVVRVGADIDKEWKVEKITSTGVICKHRSGVIRELSV